MYKHVVWQIFEWATIVFWVLSGSPQHSHMVAVSPSVLLVSLFSTFSGRALSSVWEMDKRLKEYIDVWRCNDNKQDKSCSGFSNQETSYFSHWAPSIILSYRVR